jgi:hypothetical protein
MPKFRKKPVVIEAVRWTGNTAPIAALRSGRKMTVEDNDLVIHTLEGDMTAQLGDWVIKGVQGEVYLCKPDIFEATYEAV